MNRIEGAIRCRHGANLRLGRGIFVSAGFRLIDDGPIEIGDNCIIGPGVTIASQAQHGVEIGPGCWLGENAEIRPGVRIGEGAMVCSGAVVESDVPSHAVVEGNPARLTWRLR